MAAGYKARFSPEGEPKPAGIVLKQQLKAPEPLENPLLVRSLQLFWYPLKDGRKSAYSTTQNP